MNRIARSFRWKLAGLVTAVCGVVLCAFVLAVWTFHVAVEEERFDHEIERLAEHHLAFVLHDGFDAHASREDPARRVEHLHEHAHGEVHPPLAAPDAFLGELFEDVHFAAFDRDDTVLAASDRWPSDLVPNAADRGPDASVRRVELASRSYRVAFVSREGLTIAVAVALERYDAAMAHVRWFLFGTSGVSLLATAMIAWAIANRALRPVTALTEVAEQVTADALDKRIPLEGEDDEFARLIRVFNGMLERLDRSFRQAARFTADASHELRTPLTIMQGHVELALARTEAGSDAERALVAQLDEIQRLKRLVRNLLVLSRADGGLLRLARAPIDLSAALATQVEDLRAIAPELEVAVAIEPGVLVEADEVLLQQALQNLTSNAVKYNLEGGSVEVRLEHDGAAAVVCISNTGPEISREDRERIFDRFYRVDAARTRAVDGVGLGLSLVREIARAHGGSVEFRGRRAGMNKFCITFPAIT